MPDDTLTNDAPVVVDRPSGLDPRGPQFAAACTSVLLIAVLALAPHTIATALLAVVALCFAIGSTAGPQHTPQGAAFAAFVRPRLAAPTELEDVAPVRFAQRVGLGFSLVGLVGFATGLTWLGLTAVGLALVAALLNAVFNYCLGCEVYLLTKRATATSAG